LPLSWIEKAIVKVQTQKLISTPEFKNGERHYFQGQDYTIKISEFSGRNGVQLLDDFVMEIQINKAASSEQVEKTLIAWYRKRLKELIPGFLKTLQTYF